MLCRNCNHPLEGSEDFCPHCGVPCKFQEVQTKDAKEKDKPAKNDLPKSRENEKPEIFRSEPVYVYADDICPPSGKKQRKNGAAVIVLSVLLILVIALFAAAQYFNLTPVLSGRIANREETTTESVSTTRQGEFSENTGTVAPDISYKPTVCYLSATRGLTLRKGPDEDYAQVRLLPYACRLQLIGGCCAEEDWVYVYVPEYDVYGWLEAGFIMPEQEVETTESEK